MARERLIEEDLTHSIIGCFFEVQRELGYGYRELIYSLALEQALIDRGHRVQREVPTMVYFRGRPLARQVLDMIVDDRVVLEIKLESTPERYACRQLYSYLWGSRFEVGLVLRFGPKGTFCRIICENSMKKRGAAAADGFPNEEIEASDAPAATASDRIGGPWSPV